MITFSAYDAIVFAFGAVVGSFLNVVGLRFLREESIVWPGSHCYHCQKPIKPYDNIPVLSWLLLQGKCRQCKAPISWQYPAVEFFTGALFVAIFQVFGLSWQALFLTYLTCNLIIILITDFREQYIFDINSIGLIPFGLVYTFFNLGNVSGNIPVTVMGWTYGVPSIFVSALLAVAGAFLIFFVLNLLSKLLIGKPGFGEGDTRLLMGLGAFFGAPLMGLIFLLSFVIQVVVGLPLLVWQWLQQKAYQPVVLFLTAFLAAGMPYVLQQFVQDDMVILLAALVLGVVAMVCVMRALKIAKNLPMGLTYLPFGPAIVLAAFIVIFFETPLLAWLQRVY